MSFTQDYNAELYHYGVKGMKWGHRKAQPQSDLQKARSNVKAANKAYNKSYNDAYRYSRRHAISQYTNKNRQKESDLRWDKAMSDARAVNTAKKEYKQIKSQKKAEFTSARQNVSKSRSTGAKIATNILAGPFANRTYNSVIAAGGTKTQARVVTAASSILAGSIGNVAVASLITREHMNR
jgi:hypothetical protein